MKKVTARNGRAELVTAEMPLLKEGYVLIKTQFSAISAGTEKTIIQISKENPIDLGYSAMGIVTESKAPGLEPGDRVACYGAPYVGHREWLSVPATLCAKVPDNVSSEAASLCGIGAIAIHALRTASLQFGETVAVVGLGPLGRLIAQIADAASYHVIGCDLSRKRAESIRELGIIAETRLEEVESSILSETGGNGADAVLLCTGGKKTPLTGESIQWVRDKGKVVIVGDVEPDFPRSVMFQKEAQILISRAGGPGRYDPVYEKDAVDYPYGYVRWTEGRNIREFLRLISVGKIDVTAFHQNKRKLADASETFEDIFNPEGALTYIIDYRA
ncbi:zinc-dependent alcohol dehydrogenase [Jeotgalibacillus terrae]|uniref:Zinc-binding alcohol dehydrogenase n=1 Tax=Jeotgalibacillus terrae TaxID=587735 RepID=A0ABW5ZD33_9BACL|nr:zinc-binding alcohol dehydrogenase [Jeotgalibacillus terrae]MBM7580118.1 threonine dehydrogenase-like Zn-dependent dehydrogenase [Jeotgalibacillus terrae]